ncbi:MAG: DUF6325 family protein [Microthrixaceae bacterium]
MSVAPVEYLIIGFEGNRFNGDIVPALLELVDNGIIKVLDVVFILKDANGDVAAFEFDELDELEPFRVLSGEGSGLLNEDDIAYAAETLEPNTSAAFLVWEDLWATRFRDAVVASGGAIIRGERIPHEAVMAAIEFDAQGDATI